jgi:hypothetical protein
MPCEAGVEYGQVSDWRRVNELDESGKPASGITTFQHTRALPDYKLTLFVFYTASGLDAVHPTVSGDTNASSTNVPDVLLQRILKAVPSASSK